MYLMCLNYVKTKAKVKINRVKTLALAHTQTNPRCIVQRFTGDDIKA
jgi:hypothetical protein